MIKEQNIDKYGRRHTYLRISLTDRCNLSCSYCTPRHNLKLLNRSEHLNLNEIVRVVRIASEFGINKIRFTGGEPLLRKDIDRIICLIKGIKGIQRVSITTNGVLLKEKVAALRDAGLDSLNISLDSLDPQRFNTITGRNAFNNVMHGIFAAIKYGFRPKINVVAIDSLGFDEADRFLDFASNYPVVVRFIEFMPLCGDGSEKTRCVPINRAVNRPINKIEEYMVRKHGLINSYIDGVARVYPLNTSGSSGAIGFISPLSHPFCNQCNRLRLSSTGMLYGCLFDSSGINIRHTLRNSSKDEELSRIFNEVLVFKKRSHGLDESNLRQMAPNIKNLIRLIGG